MKISKKTILGIFFSLLFLALVIYKLDFYDFFNVILTYKLNYICIFIPIYIINQIIKGIRWKFIINDNNLNTYRSFNIFSVGNALNICMPFRFGDFWKAYHMGEFLNISKAKALGTVVSERALDFLSLIPILIFIICRYLRNDFTLKLLWSALIIALFTCLGFCILILFNKYIKNFKFLSNLIDGIKNFKDIKTLIFCFILTLLARGIECILVFLLLLGAGLNIGISSTLFVIVFNAMAGMIPSVSNYIGAYQYSYIIALGIYGVPKSVSFAVVTVYEFLTLAILGITSLIYFVKVFKKD